MILNSPTISGSLTVTGNIIASGSITLSGSVASASYASNAELLDGLDSTQFTLTSSFAAQTASFTAFTASILSYTSSQNILNGTYATTGSNTFTGVQTVNSNLVVTGSITAQTLVVQTITSSVDFVTGSTRFGSSLSTSTHEFTGSVNITGSVAIASAATYALDVSGTGRFTGALTADYLTANSGALINTTSSPFILYNSGGGGNAKRFAQSMTNGDYMKIYSLNDNGTTRTDNILTATIGGNVGIGTTSPNRKFSVNGDINATDSTNNWDMVLRATSTESQIRSTYSGAGGFNPMTFYTSDTERMRITSGGNVGIGTSTPAVALHILSGTASSSGRSRLIHATSGAQIDTYVGVSDGCGIIVNNNPLFFEVNSAERMRITSGGNVLVATTSNSTNNIGGPRNFTIGNVNTAGTGRDVWIYMDDSDMRLYTNNTQRILITSGGAINIVDSYFIANSAAGYRFNNQADTFNNVIMYDNGNVSIRGALSKGSGTFRIDHPLESKKNTHQLIHSFVEGPRADLIYRGTVTLVNGTATINIDTSAGMTEGTFVALNRETQFFITNQSGWNNIKGLLQGNILTIEAEDTNSTDTIAWMVVGERQDKHIKDTDWTDSNGKPILEPLKSTE